MHKQNYDIINEHNIFKNPTWQEADQFAIYKAWRHWIQGHKRQIHLVAEGDCRITSPAPYH